MSIDSIGKEISATIIIGANYGDEGKGLATDYMTDYYKKQNKKVLNVLHNGGAQRAHTVQIPNGIRHVFHTVGSGTFSGADTMLTGAFMVNPIELRNELEILKNLGYSPKIYITDHCRITTPWDMMGNQIYTESKSLNKQQGTCGMGIWETVLRNESIRLTIEDLFIALTSKDGFEDTIRYKLNNIREYYKTHRLNFSMVSDEWKNLFMSDKIMKNFIEDLQWMILDTQIQYAPLYYEKIQPVWIPWEKYDHIIFENGQGMLIDGDIQTEMEFNTPSHTTMANPVYLLKQWSRQKRFMFEDIECIFVTRTYLTRHGRGTLIGECDISYLEERKRIFDKTNIPNQWQGSLRYGKFDYDTIVNSNNSSSLRFRIQHETSRYDIDNSNTIRNTLFITHADEIEVDGYFGYLISKNDETLCSNCLISYGPTRDDVHTCKFGTIQLN